MMKEKFTVKAILIQKEKTNTAHYFNHENIGAYNYLANSRGEEKDLHIANLIFHHMDFFKGEKYFSKIYKRFGNIFMNELKILHEADLASH